MGVRRSKRISAPESEKGSERHTHIMREPIASRCSSSFVGIQMSSWSLTAISSPSARRMAEKKLALMPICAVF